MTTLLLITGCGGEPPEQPAPSLTVVSAAGRANVCLPATTPELDDIVDDVVHGRGRVTTVVADGDPRVEASVQLRNTANNPATQAKQDEANLATVKRMIADSIAVVGQADQLRAVGLAADSLANAQGDKILVVLDSGLQTTAPLRFEDGSLLQPDADPEAIAEFVSGQEAVPNLSGVRVVWLVAATAAPQATLTVPAQRKVQDIWRAILTRGNPASLDFIAAFGQCAAANGPDVAVVPVPALQSADIPGQGSPSSPASVTPPSTPNVDKPAVTAPFLADRLTFEADSATFADPLRAQDEVRLIAEQLVAGRYSQIEVTGTTANWGDNQGQQQLSLARAMAVRDLLIHAGVDPAAITSVRGVGSDFPGHIPEVNSDGTLNERLAAQNRLVIVSATE